MNTPKLNNTTPKNEMKGEIFHATMNDIYHVLMGLKKEKIGSENEHAAWMLSEQWFYNHTVDGKFEYSADHWSSWILEKIKQYKPEPQKAPKHFVVEM